ncbi:TIGR03620 family F420-dependent LLM class oxidoreductase [Streptomyces sp. NPDC058486]|uniref:TIGR03620 family F420-dependent LLM class oxidoreductase n=1 Tax=unclassified Streptomyces TaxID=2593676 RepID=UPI003657D896
MDLNLGRIGIWSLAFTHGDRGAAREAASELEELGYGALWLGGSPGGNPRGDLITTSELLTATKRTVVAPACVSIWHQPARALAAAYHALPARMRDRLLLGLGVGHPKLDRDYHRPYTSLRAYLDGLDRAPALISRSARLLCAHGTKMTLLAAVRTAGVQPHYTTVGHTAHTRELLGESPLLAPSVSVVLETDPGKARAMARAALAPYLAQANYANTWLRSGFGPDDLEAQGSDRLVDSLFAWGTLERIAEQVTERLAVGADHAAVQVVTDSVYGFPLAEWRALAQVLPLKGAGGSTRQVS